jgi:FkbM family methyltransferase
LFPGNIGSQYVSLVRKVPGAVKHRLRYGLHPRALRWKYMEKHSPTRPLITQLGLEGDLKVRIYPHDVIGRYIYIDRVFEPDSWDFVEHFLKPGMIVFDLGANLGQYTLLAARCTGPEGHVHSFEPGSRMFDELRFNVSLNGFADRCTLNNLAVSDKGGSALLAKCARGNEVYASLGHVNRPELQDTEHEEVSTVRLDDYVAKQGIDRVDFMKIDIEGAELLALRGAETLLSGPNAPVILIELIDINTQAFGYKAVDVWDFLQRLGYKMYSSGGDRQRLKQVTRPDSFSVEMDLVAAKGHL